MMTLIGSTTSPFVRKVRIVLAEKKLEYKLVLDDVWQADNIISRHNPLGKVPCLIMEGEHAVFDSRVIVDYVDGMSPVSRLIPSGGRERAIVKTWEALADGICDAAVLIRLESVLRTEDMRYQPWLDRQMQKITAGLELMAHELGDKTYCTGNQFSLADIAVGCALGFLDFRFSEINWREQYPNLNKLLTRLQQRPTFIDTSPVVV